MKWKKNTQKVGFTTIKMEDGLRCDPCACFYLDKKDYIRHMTKFHENRKAHSVQKPKKRKGGCNSCCQQCDCTGVHVSTEATDYIQYKKQKKTLRNSIQSKWNRIAGQLVSVTEIKMEKEADCDVTSHAELTINAEIKGEIEEDTNT